MAYDYRTEEERSAADSLTLESDAAAKKQRENAATGLLVDPGSPNYKGPGWELTTDSNGVASVRLSEDPMRQIAQTEWESSTAPSNVPEDISNPQPAPSDVPEDLNPYEDKGPILMSAFKGTVPLTTSIRPVTSTVKPPPRVSVNQTARDNLGRVTTDPKDVEPGAQARDLDRTRIDPIFDSLNKYSNLLDQMIAADDSSNLSAAEAQLLASQKLSQQRMAVDLEANQRGALGQARAARNRGDAALLERTAIGESAFLGQEAARTQAMQQTQYEGDLAELRANEELEDKKFKADLIQQASDMGLNIAGIEMGIADADLESATNWINNEFDQLGLNKQLSQQEAESLRDFSVDMATIAFQYEKLSSEEQMALEQLIMDKYQIDEQTRVALKKIQEEYGFKWEDLATNFVSGFSSGLGGALGKRLGSGGAPSPGG